MSCRKNREMRTIIILALACLLIMVLPHGYKTRAYVNLLATLYLFPFIHWVLYKVNIRGRCKATHGNKVLAVRLVSLLFLLPTIFFLVLSYFIFNGEVSDHSLHLLALPFYSSIMTTFIGLNILVSSFSVVLRRKNLVQDTIILCTSALGTILYISIVCGAVFCHAMAGFGGP